jgi:glycerol-3-phosphate dehydrogenase
VREALQEREVLWAMAPHIVRPLRFVLPHHGGMRPAWLLRLGLFIYDHLGKRKKLPPTRTLDLRRDPAGAPLKGYAKGFEYSDCWVDDARLVVLNAMDAAARGATVRTRARCVAAAREEGGWTLTVEERGQAKQIRAAVLVNAAGPWVAQVLNEAVHVPAPAKVRLVQGSHIVVPKLFEHDRCYIFQNADNRIVFAIPYERDFTLIGTTDRDFEGDPAGIAASREEIAYLCGAAREYFANGPTPADVVWSYSGVRPLYDDGTTDPQAVTRDYVLALDAPNGAPALFSVFGGKITTYRRLAVAALEKLGAHLPRPPTTPAGWSAAAPLPGGDFAVDGVAALVRDLNAQHPWLAPQHATRLVRAYGTRAAKLLDGVRGNNDLGENFGADLTAREVEYLMDNEWAEKAADVVWRRSKLGLRMRAEEIATLEDWMARRARAHAA